MLNICYYLLYLPFGCAVDGILVFLFFKYSTHNQTIDIAASETTSNHLQVKVQSEDYSQGSHSTTGKNLKIHEPLARPVTEIGRAHV